MSSRVTTLERQILTTLQSNEIYSMLRFLFVDILNFSEFSVVLKVGRDYKNVLGEPCNMPDDDEFLNNSFRIKNSNEIWFPIQMGFIHLKQKEKDVKKLEYAMDFIPYIQKALNNSNEFQNLLKRANTDSLTHIYNREYFQMKFKELENYSKAVLIIMDIDHFKIVNDTYGHGVGDVVLKKTCELIKNTIRPSDVFARLGGEEFALILPDANTNIGMQRAEKIRILMEKQIFEADDGRKFSITGSFGVAGYPNVPLNKLFKSADDALYESKNNGRNRITLSSNSK